MNSFFSKSAFEICRVFGVPIRLDISIILTAAYYILSQSFLDGILITLAILIAVALHELGHVAIALLFKSRVTDITLYFMGGIASMLNIPKTPWKEAAIAAAGPIAGFILFFLAEIISPLLAPIPLLKIPAILFCFIGQISLWLSIFNLIPAFPMDGGRIFRALLARIKGRIWASRVACKVAYVCAAIMGLLGLGFFKHHFDPFLILIAFFVWSSARKEMKALNHFGFDDDDDDTIIISPPPYGGGSNDYTKIHRKGN